MKNKLVAAMIGIFILGFAGFSHADVVGNKDSKIFHTDQCYLVKQMKAENKVNFKTADEAIKAGYKPCSKCKPADAATAKAAFVGSKDAKKFHKADCRIAANIKSDNLVTFATKEEAEKAGYTPCAICLPTDKKADVVVAKADEGKKSAKKVKK